MLEPRCAVVSRLMSSKEYEMRGDDFPLDLFFLNIDDFDIVQEKGLYDQKTEVVMPVGEEITAANLLPKLEELPMLQLLEGPSRFPDPHSASCPPSIAGSPPGYARSLGAYQLPSPDSAKSTSSTSSASGAFGSSPPKSVTPGSRPKPYQSQPSSPRQRRNSRKSISDRSAIPLKDLPRHMRPSHIDAEHRRRCKIQNGFDEIFKIVPSVKETIENGGKDCKASILKKTADYCRQLHQENKELEKETEQMKDEISKLTSEIGEYQKALPVSGVELNKPSQPETTCNMFEDYLQARVLQNWKFWIFSMVARPMFETFNERVSTDNLDEFNRNVMAWTEKNCSLVSLRPAMLDCLRQLSTQSSVMSHPERLPEEALKATMTDILKKEEKMRSEETNNNQMDTL